MAAGLASGGIFGPFGEPFDPERDPANGIRRRERAPRGGPAVANGVPWFLLNGMTTINQADFPCQEKKCLNSKIMNVIQQMAAAKKR
jgi:hypothetical protein